MTILLGYGSHGRDIHAIWNRDPEHQGKDLDLYDVNPTAGVKRLAEIPSVGYDIFIGINKPLERRSVYNEYRRWHRHPDPGHGPSITIVDPTAIITNSSLGDGVVVAPNVLMLTDVHVGSHTHINYGTQMTRCRIGSFVTIAPGVTICGDVTIGNNTFIGAGAVISNLVKIGNDCVIGAGAVVISDIPDGVTAVGVPAKWH